MPSPQREENGKFPTFAFPGGYPIYYLMADNEILCPDCANLPEAYTTAEKREAIKSGIDQEEGTPDYTDRDWEIVAVDIHEEGLPLTCANCNKEIPSAYGPTDDDYIEMIKDWWHQITGDYPRGTDLLEVVEYVKDGDKEEDGNYNVVGELVKRYISELDAITERPAAGRRQKFTFDPITYEAMSYGGYLVKDETTGRTVYIQTDLDFPSLAMDFGWSGRLLPKTKLRAVNIKDDDLTGAEIYSAILYLDEHEGDVVEDPGYFGE
jgi:hypothetical protein